MYLMLMFKTLILTCNLLTINIFPSVNYAYIKMLIFNILYDNKYTSIINIYFYEYFH
jgi:hypothetical protein